MEGRAVRHNFERDPHRDHPCQVWFNLVQRFQRRRFKCDLLIKISSPFFTIFSLAAILVGSQDQRTQFWKRAIQIPFHQSLAAIGPVISEEKIKVYDVRRTPSDGKSSHGLWPGELKRVLFNRRPLKRCSIHLNFSMTGQEKCELLQVTA